MSPSTVLLWLWTHAAQIAIAGSLFSTGYYVVTRSWRAHQSPTKPTWRVVIEVILELLPNIPSAVNKILIAFGKPGILPPAQVARTTRPSDGQAGCARVPALAVAVMIALGAGLLAPSCHPTPPPTSIDGGIAQPASWTDSARTALDACDWIVPAVRVAVQLIPVDPAGKAAVVHAIDVVIATALPRLHHALDAYVAHGGDRCEVQAAAAGLDEALLGITDSIAQLGWGPAREVGQLVDALAALVDTLAPACGDAGWTSAGNTANARLLGAHRSHVLVLVHP